MFLKMPLHIFEEINLKTCSSSYARGTKSQLRILYQANNIPQTGAISLIELLIVYIFSLWLSITCNFCKISDSVVYIFTFSWSLASLTHKFWYPSSFILVGMALENRIAHFCLLMLFGFLLCHFPHNI